MARRKRGGFYEVDLNRKTAGMVRKYIKRSMGKRSHRYRINIRPTAHGFGVYVARRGKK